jgi:hypothetical protein
VLLPLPDHFRHQAHHRFKNHRNNLNRDKIHPGQQRLDQHHSKLRHNLLLTINNQGQEKWQILEVEKVHHLFLYHQFLV